jgi:hypothetical protein
MADDANVRIPAAARDSLMEAANQSMTPAERAERAAKAKATLYKLNGYDPSPEEERALDAEINRRLGIADAA